MTTHEPPNTMWNRWSVVPDAQRDRDVLIVSGLVETQGKSVEREAWNRLLTVLSAPQDDR